MLMHTEIFLICLIAGLIMIGAELFVPGGILGVFGLVLLVIASIVGYIVFPEYGAHISLGVLLLTILSIVAWIKFFPKSRFGNKLTVSTDLRGSSATEPNIESLVGQFGEALSPLRPSGFARIGARRVDVVTQGEMIAKGESIKVVNVEGNRIVVQNIKLQNTSID